MARQPFEYGPDCDGPDVDINIIPTSFPLCDEVIFEDPNLLLTCIDFETVDFIVPPVCPCFPERMGLTDSSSASIACGGPLPSITFDAAIVNVAPDDCCNPEFKLDITLDIQVPCVGAVGGCDEIIGQVEVDLQEGPPFLFLDFEKCIDDQGNILNDPCCIRLVGELVLPCINGITFKVEYNIQDTGSVDIPTIDEFTIEESLTVPCEYDVVFDMRVPLPYEPPPINTTAPGDDDCCNGLGYCPEDGSFTDLGGMYTGKVEVVTGITCGPEVGEFTAQKLELDYVCGYLKGVSSLPDDGCPTTTTTTAPPSTTAMPFALGIESVAAFGATLHEDPAMTVTLTWTDADVTKSFRGFSFTNGETKDIDESLYNDADPNNFVFDVTILEAQFGQHTTSSGVTVTWTEGTLNPWA